MVAATHFISEVGPNPKSDSPAPFSVTALDYLQEEGEAGQKPSAIGLSGYPTRSEGPGTPG